MKTFALGKATFEFVCQYRREKFEIKEVEFQMDLVTTSEL